MSGIKKLAGQTLWYGVPKIVQRFLNYGLTLLGFRLFDPATTSDLTQIYAVIPFLNVLFAYGLETSFFRFAQLGDREKLYDTMAVSVTATTVVFSLLLFLARAPLTHFLGLDLHPEYVNWMIGILFFDTLSILPLSKLRLEERPAKYALVNIGSVIVNILIVLFFLFYARKGHQQDPHHLPGLLYDPTIGVGYFLLANLVASAIVLVFLYKEIAAIRWVFDRQLWKRVMLYSYPLIIVGFGGMINEMLSRVIYRKVAPGSFHEVSRELGIFGANYRLAVLITIFIQIFRMAAEPFFFNQSARADAPRMYARIMKFFVIACCWMFLLIVLFLDVWKKLISSGFSEYAEGIHVVPILSLGAIFLGIYYNLAIWYKLTDRNMYGAYITIAGAAVTVVLNVWWIPVFGYTGSAWATFICYALMMTISYVQGQKFYPVPYARKKLLAYLSTCVLLYGVHELICRSADRGWAGYPVLYYGSAMILMACFLVLVVRAEAHELRRMPYIGKTFYRNRA